MLNGAIACNDNFGNIECHIGSFSLPIIKNNSQPNLPLPTVLVDKASSGTNIEVMSKGIPLKQPDPLLTDHLHCIHRSLWTWDGDVVYIEHVLFI